VTVRTHEARNVVRIPNAALRFKPSPPLDKDGKPEPQAPLPALKHGTGRVYLLADTTPGKEKAEPKALSIGITDGVHTEIKGGELAAGTQVVVDETDQDPKKQQRRNMF